MERLFQRRNSYTSCKVNSILGDALHRIGWGWGVGGGGGGEMISLSIFTIYGNSKTVYGESMTFADLKNEIIA